MQKIQGKQITIILTDEQLETLERIAKRHGLMRSQVTRNCLDVGIEVYTDFEKAGMPQFIEVLRKTKKAVRDYLQPKLV